MARPERNTVDYFPHFIGGGKKMFFIEKKYGNDGYATWYKILEKIAETEYHYLNLNNEEEIIYLSAKCNISEELLLSIINDLTRIGAFDKNLWQSRVIWSQKFIDEIQDAYKRRSNNCMSYDSLCKHLIGLCILKVDINPQSRVDKSRVELSKDNIVGLPMATPTDKMSFAERSKRFIDKFNEMKLSKYQATEKVKEKLKARLVNYSSKQIIEALSVALTDPMHIEQSFKYLTPEYILRPDILERYLNFPKQQNSSTILSAPPAAINHQQYEEQH